ncbi:Fc receptor-like A isoform X5 [Hippopotamus amphibius kiboko]|uniref:Fc receptor-like A isoform X5 n=1 Tax=Hippopotamus amphibius kiboko TaxID=575201 RepID=UPI0025994F9B|nr:Fc receptor-like A isoform X5 [Hippopotamus amphibius kiboko]
MKLGYVLMAGAFYFSPAMLWAAQMLLAAGCHAAASFEALQCERPLSTQKSSCHTEDGLTGPREVDFEIKGYTFSEPFHLIVSYDWLILQSPTRPIFEGDPMVLRCQAWQDWPLTRITFYRDGAALGPPGPDKEFFIAVAQKADSGHYHCSATFRSPGPGSPETASPAAITVQGPSSSAAPPTLNPAPQKSAAPETTSTEPPGPPPPLPTPSSKDPGSSSPLRFPDPHLHHQMGVLLKHIQDVRALLGHLVMELRDLSGHLKLETTKGHDKYE